MGLNNKKTKFLIFGRCLNLSLTVYRFITLNKKSGCFVFILDINPFFIKILEINLLIVLSIILPSLYLRKKICFFLEKIIIKYNFFPKTFQLLISLEYWFCLNPILTFFILKFVLVEMVEDHFKLNPFLDEAEYSHIEQDMLDDFAHADDRPSTSTGLHEEDLDDRPSTSTGLHEKDFDDRPSTSTGLHEEDLGNWPPTLPEQSQQDAGESPSRLWKQNLGDLQDLNEEIDTLARENDRERRLESAQSLKQKIIEAANNEKEEGEIGAYYEKNGDNPPDSPPDNSDPDQKEDKKRIIRKKPL